MARLGCVCGGEMTNTQGPSKHVLNVFYMSEAEAAISYDPQIRLWDFYTGWDDKKKCDNSFQKRSEPVEYWHCTECGRVHEVQAISCGKRLRTYCPHTLDSEPNPDPNGMKELLVLTDVNMDMKLAEDNQLTLLDYLNNNDFVRYFITEDEQNVYAQENGQWKKMVYDLEPV